MMYFSAHYSDRDPAYFMAVDWPQGARHGSTLGTMITLYWLADDGGLAYEALTGQLGKATEAPRLEQGCVVAGRRVIC